MNISKVIKIIFRCKIKYIFNRNIIICDKNSLLKIEKGVKLSRCHIYLSPNCDLTIKNGTIIRNSYLTIRTNGTTMSLIEIGNNCFIENANIKVCGTFKIGEFNIIEKGYNYNPVNIDIAGTCIIGHHNRIRCKIWTRYNSILSIGHYNNINEESEIRCDDNISIGKFNQISYKCSIWDTNTHSIYKALKRRELTITKYPGYGYEYEKPKTKPVSIGDDNWIGKNSAILKGTSIGDKCIIGYSTILSNIHVPNNKTITQKIELSIFDNEI